MIQNTFHGFGVSLEEKEAKAIEFLRLFEPNAIKLNSDGYWLAFSGGKDSIVIYELAKRAGVKFKAVYNQTTIDPPELIHFIKQHYPQVEWRRPKRNFFKALQDTHGLPTRFNRWCCKEFKEHGGDGTGKIIGVRADESDRRKKTWKEVNFNKNGFILCPILWWSDQHIWQFIRSNKMPYCSLYDEGFTRIGCVGCPQANREIQFRRWPLFEKAWRTATRKYFQQRKGKLNRSGKPYFIRHFKTSDDFFNWWISDNPPPETDNEPCLGISFQ